MSRPLDVWMLPTHVSPAHKYKFRNRKDRALSACRMWVSEYYKPHLVEPEYPDKCELCMTGRRVTGDLSTKGK